MLMLFTQLILLPLLSYSCLHPMAPMPGFCCHLTFLGLSFNSSGVVEWGPRSPPRCFPLPGRWQHLHLLLQVATSQEQYNNNFRSSGFAHHPPKLSSVYWASCRSFLHALLTGPHSFPAHSCDGEFTCSLEIRSRLF